MLGLSWSEIGVILVVAMVLIGPKDMPIAIRAVADFVKKARRMAGEFQSHVDEMMRDSNMQDVRNSIAEIRNFDIRGEVSRAVDSDGSLRSAFSDDPFKQTVITPLPKDQPVQTAPLVEPPKPTDGEVSLVPSTPAPAFVPPGSASPTPPVAMATAPAFIPPEAARDQQT